MDWWALGNPSASTVGYTFWHDEMRRRADDRLTAELVEATTAMASLTRKASAQTDALLSATKKMETLTGEIKWWTKVNGVLAAAVLVVAIITLAVNA